MKLTESKLKTIIRQCLNEADSYGWVVETDEAQKAYDFACDYFGEDDLNRQIVRTMGSQALSECLAYIFRINDFREWEKYKDGETDNEDELNENKALVKQLKGVIKQIIKENKTQKA